MVFITLIHELGHALGLAHPHDEGGGSSFFPGVSSSGDPGSNNLNQNIYTVMSYRDISSGNNPNQADNYGFCKGPMAFDIATIKYLYGLKEDYKISDNVYEITEGDVVGTDGYTCIYDTSGNDIIIYNGLNRITIDLRPATISNNLGGGGYLSKVDDQNTFSGFTISNNTIIENAEGGSNSDNFYQPDSISNIINGRDGIDNVIYSGNYNEYTLIDLSENNDGSYVTVTKNNVTDHLHNIEHITFTDELLLTTCLDLGTKFSSNIAQPGLLIDRNNLVVSNVINIDNMNDYLVENVEVILEDIEHTWVGDLKITLTHLDSNVSIVLLNLPGSGVYGSSGDDFKKTIITDISDKSIDSIVNGDSPHTGFYCPSDNSEKTYLSIFNDLDVNGSWELKIEDTYPQSDNGYLKMWSLRFKTKDKNNNNNNNNNFSVGNILVDNDWITVQLEKSFSDPVVIISDPTYNSDESVSVRLKNITSNSFEIRLHEPSNQDGLHISENLNYIVGESGTINLDTNFAITFGKLNTNAISNLKNFETVQFNSFINPPTVFTQIQTFNDTKWSITRTREITTSNFKISMQNQESLKKINHLQETIGYMLVTEGNYNGDFDIESKKINNVKNIWKNITFNSPSNDYYLFTKLSSYAGSDPANTRIRDLTDSNFSILVQEDTSKDTETRHVYEEINYFKLKKNIVGIIITNIPEDINVNVDPEQNYATVTWDEPTVNDISNLVSLTSNYQSGDIFPIGITTIIYTAEDNDGNITTASFQITVIDNPNNNYSFEFGKINVQHNWITVQLQNTYINPVVIVSDSTFNNNDPVCIKLRNVASNSFDIKLQEPSNLDGTHVLESLTYIVGEIGSINFDDNFTITFGKIDTDKISNLKNFETIQLDSLSNIPTIFTQIQTSNDSKWSVTRTKNNYL